MRTHSEIVKQASVTAIRRRAADLGVELKDATVRAWMKRSIPEQYWPAFVAFGFATMRELEAGAPPKRPLPPLAVAVAQVAA